MLTDLCFANAALRFIFSFCAGVWTMGIWYGTMQTRQLQVGHIVLGISSPNGSQGDGACRRAKSLDPGGADDLMVFQHDAGSHEITYSNLLQWLRRVHLSIHCMQFCMVVCFAIQYCVTIYIDVNMHHMKYCSRYISVIWHWWHMLRSQCSMCTASIGWDIDQSIYL